MSKKLVLLQLVLLYEDEGYEALYFNDIKVDEGNPLQEGTERFVYLLNICDKYGVNYRDLHFYSIASDYLSYGELPERFSEVSALAKKVY